MNKIVESIYKQRLGHYCHAIEVVDVYELTSCIDQLYDEFIKVYTLDDIIQFFDTIELYCTNDTNEKQVYDFDIKAYILSL